jgi:hypothetical protein
MSKSKQLKFTFKKEPREAGLRSIGYPHQSVQIKLGGKIVGTIYAPNWRVSGWRVAVMVNVPAHENCPWSWRFLKSHETEQDARDWITANAVKLIDMNLHSHDDDDIEE